MSEPTTETDDERVVSFDASCSCGMSRHGFWSADEADDWAENHECSEALDE